MYHTVYQQQNYLNRAFLKNYFLSGIVSLILALSSLTFLKASDYSALSLINFIFLRYNIFFGLIPTFILVLLSTLKIRLGDTLRCHTRNVLLAQIVYRIIFNSIIITATWFLAIMIVIFLSGYFPIFLKIWAELLLRIVYFEIVILVFGFISAIFFYLTENKILTFLLVFAINCLSFILNINHQASLFYDFLALDFGSIIFSRSLILLGLLFLTDAILNLIIVKKDFL
ncbi:hypothetical protein [Lactobacillus sp. ESL0230]|uniref:hypothetical protein n=1 Tax=Lactobacillus sp. ESL0230 TaxID=2069353 RepID=UPI000EFDA632|nr:hypothetical protein [Lactobacillus sp. ESL0230]RMC45245.1 hypothetical protein F5ESL0230_06490 [Lactobacillus sp. ESL0230]